MLRFPVVAVLPGLLATICLGAIADYADKPRAIPNSSQSYTSQRGWTAGKVESRRPVQEATILRAVRTGRHRGFDRVVFEFRAKVPGYEVEYVDKPVRDCGSGDVVPVRGHGWLMVRMIPAHAHTEDGRATVKFRRKPLRLAVLRELVSTCDFEAHVEWVLGVSSPNRFRVFELSNPSRLVVDIRHR